MCNLRQGLKIKRTFADGTFLFLEGGGETCVFYLLVFNIFFSGCISFSCVVFVCSCMLIFLI